MDTPKAFTAAAFFALALSVSAQNRTDVMVSSSPQQSAGASQQAPAAAPSSAPLTLTLQDALQRAKANSPQFQAAVTELGLAHSEKVQARANMLHNVS